jgi:hypothetical protein
MNLSKDMMNKLLEKPSDTGDSSFVSKTSRGMHKSMQTGSSLLQMNSRALNQFAVFLNEIGSTEKQITLWHWVRDCFNLASAEALYGRENPIAEDHSLIQSLEYVSGLPPISKNSKPWKG